MAKLLSLSVLFILVATLNISLSGTFVDDKKVYIVYMGALLKSNYSPLAHHQSILEEVLEDSLPSESLIRSYTKSFNGFAAKLTKQEQEKLAGKEDIVTIFPSKTLKLHTTRYWDFMVFPENVRRDPTTDSDIVIGMIDTGIYPESESFSDEGFGPPPKKWKGTCNGGKNFTCNNKLIGARYYSSDTNHDSALDDQGHGTHTASTAAGNKVQGANFYGIAHGDARGGMPSARIATYKACWKETGCADSHVLGAFDDAISDGVDIISVSLGAYREDYSQDVIAIGSFHALQKGVLTTTSAGNNGPSLKTLENVAPWTLGVAASTMDRRIVNKVILGNNTILEGRAVNVFDLKGKKCPLVSFYEAGGKMGGKIVLQTFLNGEYEIFEQKAAGMIMTDSLDSGDVAKVHPFPFCLLDDQKGEMVQTYMKTTKKPKATITKSEEAKEVNAPRIIPFSSRGPNHITPGILKPDITAPGVEILAAWSPGVSPSNIEGDTRYVKFNVISGTSMSCPHVTGAAAYVKSFHPDWSPSAIKSALMTTAFSLNTTENPDLELSYGSGHIDPVKAITPGLVYDADEGDYIKMLCSIGYTTDMVRLIAGNKTTCPKKHKGTAKDLNYPSMATDGTIANFTRTVTNVGAANSTYKATITSSPNLKVTVDPKILSFKSLNEKQSFIVKVSTSTLNDTQILSASLVWSDGVHIVRSPIVMLPYHP